jgi:hypothetical protein
MKSIGDFAASLIEGDIQNIKEGKEASPSMNKNTPKVEPGQKDIRNVDVPDEFMQSLLGESYNPNPWPSQELDDYEEPEPEVSNALTGEPLPSTSLLTESQGNEIISLLHEVKGMIEEMTSTGMLGVNLAGPAATNPTKTKKKRTRKDVLKESLRAKVNQYR